MQIFRWIPKFWAKDHHKGHDGKTLDEVFSSRLEGEFGTRWSHFSCTVLSFPDSWAAPGWCRSGFVPAACRYLEYPNMPNATSSKRTSLMHEPGAYISIRIDGDLVNNICWAWKHGQLSLKLTPIFSYIQLNSSLDSTPCSDYTSIDCRGSQWTSRYSDT